VIFPIPLHLNINDMKISYQLTLTAFGAALFLASCGGGKKEDPNAAKLREDSLMAAEKARQDSIAAATPKVVSIVETATADGRFSTLIELLTTAGLVETLSDTTKTFTVFAPTNDAFAAFDQKRLEALRTDEKKRQELSDLLTYHVVSGTLMAADLGNYNELDALDEKVIKLTRKDGSTMAASATITQTDIACANGVIHVVDKVMTPPAKKGKATPPAAPAPTTTTTTTTTPTSTSTGRGGNQDVTTTSTGRGGNQNTTTTSGGRGGN
jgi:uncharacterized surface protein with fasciclin (FAS1) repeats